MSDVSFNISTSPMAAEINSVSSKINGTTAAVVGMKAAVIKAEEDAANHVCDNVNRGFYALIHSQISQKIAKLQSEVDSHLMQLNQQRKQLLAIKNRMERDYNNTSSRYLKLFTGLNKNLQQRIFELDKPTIEFAVKEVDKVSNRTKQLTATVPVSQLESVSASQKILTSNIKYRGMKVIESMARFLSDMNEQKALTEKILLQDRTNDTNSSVMVPVIMCESDIDQYHNKRFDVMVNSTGLSSQTQNQIYSMVNSVQGSIEWEDSSSVDENLAREFAKCVNTSSMSQRVKDMTNQLFAASPLQTIKK